MLPRFWVASTKPGAALARVKGSVQPLQGRGRSLAQRDRRPEAGVYSLRGHYPPLEAARNSAICLTRSSPSDANFGITLLPNWLGLLMYRVR